MTGPLYRSAKFLARHHWPVIGFWVVLAVVLHLIAASAGQLWNDDLTLPGTGSTNATNLLKERLPQQAYGSIPIVLRATKGTLEDSAAKQAVNETVNNLKANPHVVTVVSPLESKGAGLLSKDRTVGYIAITLNISSGETTTADAQKILDATKPATDAGLKASVGGYVGQKLSRPSTESSEALGLAAAVIILLFAFGTATAMAMPIVTAIIGLVTTLAILTMIGHITSVPTVAPTLATMIGLGVGIDYALFIVTKHKLQLADGMEVHESVARATATAGGAVVFAGLTVAIALCSLAVAGIPLVTTLGYTSAIAVVVSVLAATTLLPAMLGALGPKINSLRVPFGNADPKDGQPHGWARWARSVARRPWPAMISALAILIVLALPLLSLTLGQSDTSVEPKSTTIRQSYDALTSAFGAGTNGPLLVAVKFPTPAKPDASQQQAVQKQQQQLTQKQQQITAQAEAQGATPQQAQAKAQQETQAQSAQLAQQKAQADSPTSDPRLTSLQNAIKSTPGVKSVAPATVDKAGDSAVFTAVATTAPAAGDTEHLVNHLRDSVIPKAVSSSGLTAYVGGQTAGYIDLAERIAAKLPLMIAVVVLLSVLVLLLAFRSLLVPIKAAVLNLLSVAAAYGVVTAVFQKGWGASLVDLPHAIPIVSFVPLFMFAILFGLSMDYEVFLVSQMREHFSESGDAREAVVDGLAQTGRVITSAALVMVCVFSSFVLNGDPVVKEFGIGLSVAIAVDATIVRCLLVPAVMELLGKRAWWLPHWLDRILPHFSIEGAEYFRAMDAGAGSVAVATARGDGRAALVDGERERELAGSDEHDGRTCGEPAPVGDLEGDHAARSAEQGGGDHHGDQAAQQQAGAGGGSDQQPEREHVADGEHRDDNGGGDEAEQKPVGAVQAVPQGDGERPVERAREHGAVPADEGPQDHD
jgi:RND superfamily putative drug exporter